MVSQPYVKEYDRAYYTFFIISWNSLTCCSQLVMAIERPFGTKSSELAVIVELGIVSIPQPNSNPYRINDLRITQNN